MDTFDTALATDFNTAPPDRGSDFELIPDGTLARLRMTIKPGNAGPGGWATPSKSSDALYFAAEFVVMEGPCAKRRFWENLTISGGKRNEQGNSIAAEITRSRLRAILESARGILPDDGSQAAADARRVPDYSAFDGLEFAARIRIEKARQEGFRDQNRIAKVITPDMREWSAIMGRPQPRQGTVEAGRPAPQQPVQQSFAPAPQQAQARPAGGKPAWMS